MNSRAVATRLDGGGATAAAGRVEATSRGAHVTRAVGQRCGSSGSRPTPGAAQTFATGTRTVAACGGARARTVEAASAASMSAEGVLHPHAVEVCTVAQILRQHDVAAETPSGLEDRRVPVR